MIPHLGEKGAADLQSKMTQLTTARALQYSNEHNCTLEIFYYGGSLYNMQKWLGNSFSYHEQPEGNLGHKMADALSRHLGTGKSIILVGSDCPEIDTNIFRQGFNALLKYDIVIGPSFDGGYYLIGVSGSLPLATLNYLFSEINWGSSQVLHQTLKKAEQANLKYQLLKKLHDIDTPEDLRYFNYHPHSQ